MLKEKTFTKIYTISNKIKILLNFLYFHLFKLFFGDFIVDFFY